MFLNKTEIKNVFKNGKIYYYKNLFKIYYYKSLITKISIIVYKKNFNKAVVRNKIKRQILNSLIINKFFFTKFKYYVIFIYIKKKIIKYNILNNYIFKIINNGKIFNNRTR